MKQKGKLNKLRNLLHDHPLMRKGGVHTKPRRVERHKVRQELKTGAWDDQNIGSSILIILSMTVLHTGLPIKFNFYEEVRHVSEIHN